MSVSGLPQCAYACVYGYVIVWVCDNVNVWVLAHKYVNVCGRDCLNGWVCVRVWWCGHVVVWEGLCLMFVCFCVCYSVWVCRSQIV